jgi:cytochrome c553
LKRIPGSTQAFTLAHIRDYWDVGDWFPDDHPPMPNVVVHGRQPHVRGCAMCHMPNGKGRPENAPIAGQSYEYIVQQLMDFKRGLRASADSRKTNTAQMIEAAADMTDDEIKDAATYFSSMKWTPWIVVKEAAVVPKTRLGGNVFLPLPGTETEPIGNRIIEAPNDVERFELRDPRSGFTAYVPPGSIQKGAALVASGGNKTVPCGICHGPDLNGLGPVPAIAGRSPSYIVRQLWDLQQGTRRGAWSALMKPVVEKLSQDDMLAIAAYVASRGQ